MYFNMTDPNPAIRVFLNDDENPKKDPYIDLRHATAGVLDEIRKKTHVKKFKNVDGLVHEYYDVNESKYREELWGYCIPSWGNLLDENGNTIEYSVKNVLWLLENNIHFSKLVSEKMDEVKTIAEAKFKEREKNS